MRRSIAFVSILFMLIAIWPAYADLENMQVGGEIRIRGNYVTNWATAPAPLEVRIPPFFVWGRSIGDLFSGAPAFNGLGVLSPYRWDDSTNTLGFVEQRTRLNVKADFTQNVSAFIELDDYASWGEDFRSDHVTGFDRRAASGDDIEIYQAYIEADQMWDLPLRLRIGRQELAFGSQWLVGPKDFGPFYSGRSFDALRLTYNMDSFTIDAWASILREGGIAEEDEDVSFYGIYGTCTALENITFDAYWLWVRDARSLNDTNFPWFVEWIEDWIGVDDYDVTNLHTIGLRAAGMVGALDFDVEAAYQFGDAGQVGFGFKPFLYGDDDAEFDAWGINATVGYTFDMAWQPRPFLRYTFYEGEDNRDLSFWDWVNPFDRPKASVSFNRLFSNQMYNGYFDLQNDFSNGHVFMAGVVAHPTESLDLVFDVGYYLVDEPFSSPVTWNFGKWRVPIAPFLPWWTEQNDDEIGWTTDLVLTYHYSEDLVFMGHWSHLFPGDGLTDGNFNAANGLLFTGGTDDDSGDFFTAETRLRF